MSFLRRRGTRISRQRQSSASPSTASTPDVSQYPHGAEDIKRRYGAWRDGQIAKRLRVLYLAGLLVNATFFGLDAVAHPEHARQLAVIRSMMEGAMLLGYVALRLLLPYVKVELLLAFFPIIVNIGVVHMILEIGISNTNYYNGINLVLLSAAVVVPFSWQTHLVIQGTSLLYYYGALFLMGTALPQWGLAIESGYFLIFTCVALQISVILYERLQRAEFAARHALENSNRKLLELDRLKSEFFANVSHELRTPLTLSVSGFRTLGKWALPTECQEVVRTGLRNSAKLLSLINELLDLAKLDSGRLGLKKRTFDLSQLVKDVAASFESSDRRHIIVRGLQEPVWVEIDPRQFRKVLSNLLANAFKFSDPDRCQIWIRCKPRHDVIDVEVEDNGIGIPPDHLDRIFERFTQVEGSASRRHEGTGIGLVLVKEIVTLHGGTVSVESELGQGSTFTITLPIGQVTEPAGTDEVDDEDVPFYGRTEEPRPCEGRPAVDQSGKPLILVVEDNPDMRRYLCRLLSLHYRVVEARNGAEALTQIGRGQPDLVLTDVMMPEMSGYDLLRAIRSDAALTGLPVILVSARAGSDARTESFDVGADDYISKPFDEQELLARIKNLLRLRTQEREILELRKEKVARFLPPQLVQLLSSEVDLPKTHRAYVTVAFLDLRGFTAFSEMAEPEDVMLVLREYQNTLGPLCSQYGGVIERYSGDGITVFFNDPIPVEDHTLKAVEMAVSMREQVKKLQEQWKERGFELGCGAGIATGYATMGVVGYENRMDYAAIGTVTNLAARLCGEAKNGQILVSSRVAKLTEGSVPMQYVGQLSLKGFHHPIETYNVIDQCDP